jgi:hypothetical protein
VAERHAQFGYPRFVIASFVGPYHRPGDVKCPLDGDKHYRVGPNYEMGLESPWFPPYACQAGVLKLSVTGAWGRYMLVITYLAPWE